MDIDFMFSFRFLRIGDTIISECLKIVAHRTLNIVQRQTFQCHWVGGCSHWMPLDCYWGVNCQWQSLLTVTTGQDRGVTLCHTVTSTFGQN